MTRTTISIRRQAARKYFEWVAAGRPVTPPPTARQLREKEQKRQAREEAKQRAAEREVARRTPVERDWVVPVGESKCTETACRFPVADRGTEMPECSALFQGLSWIFYGEPNR